ncbi:MAG: TetR/AcrR family transcriptional regulator [Chloroflexi bacterium]|nr:TetR/AcrR family transcriptional regulator [Chloroflexota bacterium]
MPRNTDSEERRAQILRAALEVFATRGYTNATISDIAQQAGLAHGTVYLYFRGKEEIFQSLVTSFTHQLLTEIGAHDNRDGEPGALADDLYRMFSTGLALCAQARCVTAVLLREYILQGPELAGGMRDLEQEFIARLSERLSRAIERGEIRHIVPEFAALIITALFGVGIRWLLRHQTAEVDALARELVAVAMAGLMTDPRNTTQPRIVSSADCRE